MSAKDAQTRFHEQWLGLAQPIEGLVFSVPVLSDAQIVPESGPALSVRFREWLTETEDGVYIESIKAFFEEFLDYSTPGMLVDRDALPKKLHFYAEEGRQEIRPSFAIARGPFKEEEQDPFGGFGLDGSSQLQERPVSEPSDQADQSWIALFWDLRDDAEANGLGLSLDKAEDHTGPWRYPPTAKMERLLRHTGVPIGFVTNGHVLRLIYAPAGESSSHLTFRFADMAEPAGRPLLAAFELLLSAARTYESDPEFTIEGLLKESRRRQADVTQDLAEQVFEAVEILLAGYEQAALRDAGAPVDWLREALEAPHDHLYEGVLSVVLRLVFLLYSEDQGLVPVDHPIYAKHLSVQGLYDELLEDAGMHPESMHHRFGAYGRLLALFRAVFLGVEHRDLKLPPRHGKLFDPSTYPFLEGGLPGSTAAVRSPEDRAAVRPPSVDDGVIYAALKRLVLFQGQRLSYRALDVEQIGSIYESLMGYHVLRVVSPAVRLGKNKVWAETEWLAEQKPAERKKWLKENVGLSTSQIDKVEEALKTATNHEELAQALQEMAPGGKKESARHRVGMGRLVLQPGDERRRSGSHYTPRALTEKIVRRTLEPVLACLGKTPTEAQILSLKVCDPAMGSGAFLVEACRHLSDPLVAIWTRERRLATITETYGDAHLHARRLVAQRCLYGVDKNPAAVELAKLSLWLVTMSQELPFTFVDHNLRCGDSLVGLDLDQISAFHWKPTKQIPFFTRVLQDALDQALEHRQEILAIAENEDPRSQEEKRRLLDHATSATKTIRMVADVCVGAFFAEDKDKAREAERARRQLLVEQYLSGELHLRSELEEMAEAIREQHAPFHWWLEFPEVFYEERPDPLDDGKVNGAAYMEAFVGNPPFMGGSGISSQFGDSYRDWLLKLHEDAHGNGDLVAHFFRRAAELLGPHGAFGLIATNTIAQGDTRTTGLKALINRKWSLFDATNSMPWPGAAAVTVSVVHGAKGAPSERVSPHIDGKATNDINSRLRPKPERPDAVGLQSNSELAYIGTKVYGQGFTLSPEERDALVKKNPKNAERIFPYLGGQEVNTSPTQDFDRYVISFGQMALEKAEQWPDLIGIVREKVKPERDKLKNNTDGLHRKKHWWQFGRWTPALYAALAPLERCLVNSQVTKHLVFAFQPTNRIFGHTLYAYPLDTDTAFAVMQSRILGPWAWLLSSSMKTDLRYAASDCFDTFPFPKPDPRTVIPELEAAGKALYDTRARFMVETDQGLTKTYNALKDPENTDPVVLELRRLHEAMDRAVLDAYGWTDVEVPPYCPVTDADKAALFAFEDEVIDRLYVLNAERAREEARLGLGKSGKNKQGKKKPGKKVDKNPGQGELF